MEQLLSTKFYIPPTRLKLVSRPRLVERINEGLHRKLTLISAPAGFGKTTLISEWVEQARSDGQANISIAWLSLDETDNNLVHFLSYFITALRRAEGVDANLAKGALAMLQSPQVPPTESILTILINDLSALSEKIILILDDYHLITTIAINHALAFLLEHLPPQLHLIITTRVDPQLPLARLRASNQLSDLRANDLSFTSPETAKFLNSTMELALSQADITALDTRTEGWIAGLQLAAISLQGQEDTAEFIKSFAGSHRLVLDYLIEEVLNQQPENAQEFLLQTSILDRMTGSLCDALTGQENGQETLEMLERANLFVVPFDDERRWYRYHQLFADLLRQSLSQTYPEKIPKLHIKAGEWFSNQGMNRDAIKHSIAGRNYLGAAELIKAIAMEIIQQGEHTMVAGWINTLPAELVKEHPYLCVLHAWALRLAGNLETSEARLVDAENALDNRKYHADGNKDTILGLIHSNRAYLTFMMGEHEKTISYANQALAQLPETADLIRTHTALFLGVAYRHHGRLQAALEVYNEILPITKKIGGKSTAVWCYHHLGDLNTEMAQLHKAMGYYEQALKFTKLHTGRSEMPFTGYVYVGIGRILRQWNQLEEAYHFTSKGVCLCREWNLAEIMALSCIEFAYICQSLGNVEQASESIQEAIQIFSSFSPWGSKYAAAHQAILNIASGDIDAAGRWVQANELIADGNVEFHREIEYLALVRGFIAQKRFEEAQSLVEKIYRITQEIGKSQTELETLVLMALVFSLQGDNNQALVHLEEAVSIAEPSGYIRTFVDEGPPMAKLLHEAVSRGIAPDYVSRLLAAFVASAPEQTPLTKTQIPQNEFIEPLTDREIEILALISKGLTNREIAERLYISMNTVKSHTRNIFSKLDVSNRINAVGKAKTLGILASN